MFVAGEEGHANTNLNFELPTDEGPFIGSAHIFQVSPEIIKVDLSGLQIGGQLWRTGALSVTVVGELPKITHPLADRIIQLRNLIEGSQ